ncbi:hypothetical protein AABB24_035269 [Solanum stoloniferum]|uniref:Uncharacterized protein n=1 Tax=Solanum stoloniferum TaxID=62892 RepID=A0ABD2R7X7_9SOLN
MGLMEALIFLCKGQFWRMAVFWTLSLILSYLQLLAQTHFSRKSKLFDRCSSTSSSSIAAIRKPICIITGATSGLGAAVSYALAKEGYCVILESIIRYTRNCLNYLWLFVDKLLGKEIWEENSCFQCGK